jgi:hypothetical protein
MGHSAGGVKFDEAEASILCDVFVRQQGRAVEKAELLALLTAEWTKAPLGRLNVHASLVAKVRRISEEQVATLQRLGPPEGPKDDTITFTDQ